MPENSGTGEITKFFGVAPGAYYNTGLGGSQGTGAMESAPLMSVGIVPVYQSSQGDPDHVVVGVGDTFSSSSDTAIIPSALLPDGAATTGIGNIPPPRPA